MSSGSFLTAALAIGVIAAGEWPSLASAASDKARLTELSDVSYGLITSFVDQTSSQDVCAFTSSNTNRYAVSAVGSGGGGAFAIASGSAQLPYDVLWSDTPNGSGGTSLIAGLATGGFTSTTNQHTCNSGPPTTASLTIVIRSTSLSAAQAGAYSGTLQITIAPE
jgi:hypothetical protein